MRNTNIIVLLLTLIACLQMLLLMRWDASGGDGECRFFCSARPSAASRRILPAPHVVVDGAQRPHKISRPPPPRSWKSMGAAPRPVSTSTPPPFPGMAHQSAAWAIKNEHLKEGAGLLFFAYGGKQLPHFLGEAEKAAHSFRQFNPNIRIAIVSNVRPYAIAL